MTEAQRQAAQKLLATALSAKGVKQSGQIMNDLELVLRGDGPNPNMGRDPEMYYFTVFGTPGDKTAWGWRVEGHHLSQNFTIANGTFTSWTPDFYGANPAEVLTGARKGLRVLAAEEDKAFVLLRALDAQQKQAAVLQDKVPNDMITTNARRVNPLTPDGLPAARMTAAQQSCCASSSTNTPRAWSTTSQASACGASLPPASTKCRSRGLAQTPCTSPITTACRDRPFSSSSTTCSHRRNHIHSVWRDFNGDFGDDVLKTHYQSAHNQ